MGASPALPCTAAFDAAQAINACIWSCGAASELLAMHLSRFFRIFLGPTQQRSVFRPGM